MEQDAAFGPPRSLAATSGDPMVLEAQQYLQLLGYPTPLDGVYGPETERAVKALWMALGRDVSTLSDMPFNSTFNNELKVLATRAAAQKPAVAPQPRSKVDVLSPARPAWMPGWVPASISPTMFLVSGAALVGVGYLVWKDQQDKKSVVAPPVETLSPVGKLLAEEKAKCSRSPVVDFDEGKVVDVLPQSAAPETSAAP